MSRRTVRRLNWRQATTLTEIGELTARYLAGEADEHPLHAGPPADETREILEPLTVLNRVGLVTVMSQPARNNPNWKQRTAVIGYCDWTVHARLILACNSAGLDSIVVGPPSRPRWRPGFCEDVPITLSGGRPHTRVGAVESVAGLRRDWGPVLSSAALDALLDSFEVHIWDPVWGRDRLLWDTLTKAIA